MSSRAKKSASKKRVIDDDTGEPSSAPLFSRVPSAADTRAALTALNKRAIEVRRRRAREYVDANIEKISARLVDLSSWEDFRTEVCVSPKNMVHDVIAELRIMFAGYQFSIALEQPKVFDPFDDEYVLEARV